MADRSVTVRFRTREDLYKEKYDESIAGYNELGHPLRSRLEIDDDKTVGDSPYKMKYDIARGGWVGQDVWIKYISNSKDPIVVRTTNGVAAVTAQNLVSKEVTETIIFTNENDVSLSGIPTDGKISYEWVGNVLTSGAEGEEAASLCAGAKKAKGPEVQYDGRSLKLGEKATGVLKVAYTETYAEIKSNASELGTVIVAVCQGKLADALQYEVEYTTTAWTINPDSLCCKDGPDKSLTISSPVKIAPGQDISVYVKGGCPPFGWQASGNGLSLRSAETEKARFNTLKASADACGDGTLKVTDICGTTVEALIETDVGCCEDQGGEVFGWADGNPEFVCMSPAFAETFGVSGGAPPYNWQVTVGAAAASWDQAQTQDPVNTLTVSAASPGTIRLRVEDACSEIIYRDVQAGMEWADDNPENIAQSDQVSVSVKGGKGPFYWSVAGTGFSMAAGKTDERSNLLVADGSACGAAEVTVVDSCGDSVSGHVRCDAGEWTMCNGYGVGSCLGDGIIREHFYTPACRLTYKCRVSGSQLIGGCPEYTYSADYCDQCKPYDGDFCFDGVKNCYVCHYELRGWKC